MSYYVRSLLGASTQPPVYFEREIVPRLTSSTIQKYSGFPNAQDLDRTSVVLAARTACSIAAVAALTFLCAAVGFFFSSSTPLVGACTVAFLASYSIARVQTNIATVYSSNSSCLSTYDKYLDAITRAAIFPTRALIVWYHESQQTMPSEQPITQ